MAILFFVCLVSLSAYGQPGQLQHFGYYGNGDDDVSLDMTKGYTNFSHFGTKDDPLDPFVRDRVTVLAQRAPSLPAS